MNRNQSVVPDPSALTGVPDDNAERPAGSKCELKIYEARYNATGNRVAFEVGIQKSNKPPKTRDHDSAMVLVRYYDTKKDLERTELEIKSPHIKAALLQVVRDYPELNVHTNTLVIRDLPKCFFHYRKELLEYGKNLKDDVARQHVSFCLRYMLTTLQKEINIYCNLMEAQTIPPGLEFPHLWMAFVPGDFIYVKTMRTAAVRKLLSMVQRSCNECHSHCTHSSWKLSLDHVDYDGREFGHVTTEVEIAPYGGYRPLSDLDVFPLKYHTDHHTVRKSLIKRGKKFISLRGVHHQQYNGVGFMFPTVQKAALFGEQQNPHFFTTIIKSRVMIDAAAFGAAKPMNRVVLKSASRFGIKSSDFSKISENDLLICSHVASGFALTEKRWCHLHVDDISDVVYNSKAFDCLILPEAQKQMIHALVRVHTDPRLSFDDVIAGKGRGMVALLHGEPGVGKTLTAESIADSTRRPLYTISSGELGLDASVVYSNLSAALQLATIWNAVVLIDEADVFLEQRSNKDLERNGLVSIFLRILEYFEGIMFLTTNRISTFDAAFKSRIHIAIKYSALSAASRREIWKTFAAKASTNSSSQWMNDLFLDGVSSIELNGRQIKNVMRTAHAMAVSRDETVGTKHVKTALQVLEEFEKDFAEDAVADADFSSENDGLAHHRDPKRRRMG